MKIRVKAIKQGKKQNRWEGNKLVNGKGFKEPYDPRHKNAYASAEAVKRQSVNLSTSKSQIVPLCPWKVPKRSPFSDLQTLGTWSFEAEKSRSPSALYFTTVIGLSCPCNR
jgi:hypothetical protein